MLDIGGDCGVLLYEGRLKPLYWIYRSQARLATPPCLTTSRIHMQEGADDFRPVFESPATISIAVKGEISIVEGFGNGDPKTNANTNGACPV